MTRDPASGGEEGRWIPLPPDRGHPGERRTARVECSTGRTSVRVLLLRLLTQEPAEPVEGESLEE